MLITTFAFRADFVLLLNAKEMTSSLKLRQDGKVASND